MNPAVGFIEQETATALAEGATELDLRAKFEKFVAARSLSQEEWMALIYLAGELISQRS